MNIQIDVAAIEQAITEAAAAAELTVDDVNQILRDYGSYIGVDDLVLDDNNTTGLVVDDEIELILVHLPQFPGIVVAAEFDPEISEQPRLLRRMLQANLSWTMTQGGCFAAIPPGNDLVLCRLVPLGDRDLERIDREFAAFIELAQSWQEELELGVLFDDGTETTTGFEPGMIRA